MSAFDYKEFRKKLPIHAESMTIREIRGLCAQHQLGVPAVLDRIIFDDLSRPVYFAILEAIRKQ